MQDEKELLLIAEKTAEVVVHRLNKLSFKLALAESCTAGLVSNLLARVSGASQVFWGSYVCYTREAKKSMLGVEDADLENGLVSRETARAMADKALEKSGVEIAASITGLAGPLGDGSNVPVGTVWIAAAEKNGIAKETEFHFEGSRNEVRLKAAIEALKLIEGSLPVLT